MISVTCGLTAEDQDQLQNPAIVLSMALPYLTKIVLKYRPLRKDVWMSVCVCVLKNVTRKLL